MSIERPYGEVRLNESSLNPFYQAYLDALFKWLMDFGDRKVGIHATSRTAKVCSSHQFESRCSRVCR